MIYRLMVKTVITAVAGLAVLMAAPSSTTAQESGADIWARSCARCHRMLAPNRYTAPRWEAIMLHMELNARLTDDEADAVLDFLVGAARPLAAAEPEPEPAELARVASQAPMVAESVGVEIYRKHCVACHGASGAGDGPAAFALNPKPTDFTKAEFWAERTDEELLEIMQKGKGTMPGYSAVLTPAEIAQVLEYVRSLGGG